MFRRTWIVVIAVALSLIGSRGVLASDGNAQAILECARYWRGFVCFVGVRNTGTVKLDGPAVALNLVTQSGEKEKFVWRSGDVWPGSSEVRSVELLQFPPGTELTVKAAVYCGVDVLTGLPDSEAKAWLKYPFFLFLPLLRE